MSEDGFRKVDTTVIRLDEHACPACGRSDRWESVVPAEDPLHNAGVTVFCDCGLGELRIVVE